MFLNLEAEQARHRLTNQNTADMMGISRSSYENKKRTGKFYAFEIAKLCKIFNCRYEYLFEWKDNACDEFVDKCKTGSKEEKKKAV